MKAIVVVDNNWGIGANNDLLFHLPKDMQFFRKTTTGKVVVMGANTFRSLPSGALPKRVNVVLDDSGCKHPNTISVATFAELHQTLKQFHADDIYVVGGATFYKLMLPFCSTALVTKVNANGNAQVFFPNLDELSNWQLVGSVADVDQGHDIAFCTYVNNDVQTF